MRFVRTRIADASVVASRFHDNRSICGAGRRPAGGAPEEDLQYRLGCRPGQGEGRPGPIAAVQGVARAAEAQALAAESIAIEGGVPTGQIAEAEGLALHAAAFNGVPDPVFHLTARAMGIVTGLAAVEPDPAAPDRDALLDAALVAATALAQLLGFRRACYTATTAADQAEATAKLTESAAGFTRAAEAVAGLLDLARLTAASGRRGKQDLN